jgi:hypothetical protein
VETAVHKTVNREATFQPAAAREFARPKTVARRCQVHVQPSLKISSRNDPEEKEAETTAKKIMRMAAPGGSIVSAETNGHGLLRQVRPEEKEKRLQRRFHSPYISRFAHCGISSWNQYVIRRKAEARAKAQQEGKNLQRFAEGQPNVKSNVEAEIRSRAGSGAPLPPSVRRFMDARFRADFNRVRIHTDDKSARLNRQLSAHAFTLGRDIFFGRNKFQPGSEEGRELIAHELTHTIQQGAAAQEPTAQRSPDATVASHNEPEAQRLEWPSLPSPREWFAGKAAAIPGFTMLTVVIGYNPITNASVDRSAGNILRGALEMIPVVGNQISEALANHGIFDKVSGWASQQFDALKDIGSSIVTAIGQFIDEFDVTDLADPGGLWDRAKRIVTEPIGRIKAFATGLADGLIQLIKDAILKPLAALAKSASPQGWDLLCAILGKDPITDEPVPQDAEAFVSAFLTFIGETETLNKIKEAKAIPRITAWFKSGMAELKGFVNEIPGLFVQAFKSLEIVDIILLPRAFAKIASVFGSFALRFITWGGQKIWALLEIIFDVVSPGALGYIKKTGAALKSILKNPLPFVGNLVNAAKLGFTNFAGNILTHLKTGLIEWLTGSMTGVYIPQALSLAEFGKFALSVLGITWAQIRGKIVKVLGPSGEKIMSALETGFDIVVALVKGGPAAAWEVIKEKLADLKETIIGGITSMVIETIVTKAVPKLIAMFIPGAGFISAIISIYDTVMVFVNKISKIIQVVTGFINSITAIAAGNIGAAAAKVESTLAGLVSLAISFLAGFVGLGKVADKVMGVIKKVQTAVDKAIDAAIAWIVGKAKALFAKLFGKKEASDDGKDVKKAVKAALQGKSIANKEDEESLISSTFAKFQPLGLKGIWFKKPSKEARKLDVQVSASLPELVASLNIEEKDQAKLFKEIMSDMLPYIGRTTIYVFYGQGKQFARVTNEHGHAESVFFNDYLHPLINTIKGEQKQGLLPAGPVPVRLDINRTPCDPCTKDRLLPAVGIAKSQGVEMRMTVSAAALPSGTTSDKGLAELMEKGIEITASEIWAVIEEQLAPYPEFDSKSKAKMYRKDEISKYKAEAGRVQSLINDAVALMKKKPSDKQLGG